MADGLREQTKALSTLIMHQQRINRTLLSNVKLSSKERSDMTKATNLYQLHEHENADSEDPAPYNPGEDGFVFSTEEIDSYLEAEQRSIRAWRNSRRSKAAA
jgi:hypothetical protein